MNNKLSFFRHKLSLVCLTILLGHNFGHAQFFTIAREQPAVVTESLEETQPLVVNTVDTIFSSTDYVPADTATALTLTEEQRRQLYIQLVYFDNEITEKMIEIYNLQLAHEAQRLRAAHRNYDDFEQNVDTSVYGAYSSSPELTTESVLAEILKVGLLHPSVVLAQAVLETGWFQSSVCRNYNNLFGLTNPRTKDYYRFDRWQDSVVAYYTKVQYKYKGGNYLRWLRELGYAEDPDYTAKLRVLLDGPLRRFSK